MYALTSVQAPVRFAGSTPFTMAGAIRCNNWIKLLRCLISYLEDMTTRTEALQGQSSWSLLEGYMNEVMNSTRLLSFRSTSQRRSQILETLEARRSPM